jgi:hypothetical protein
LTTGADIQRDNDISRTLEIDPRFVNWIGKALRRDGRYQWTEDYLKELGVWGLRWSEVTDDQIRELALKLARK